MTHHRLSPGSPFKSTATQIKMLIHRLNNDAQLQTAVCRATRICDPADWHNLDDGQKLTAIAAFQEQGFVLAPLVQAAKVERELYAIAGLAEDELSKDEVIERQRMENETLNERLSTSDQQVAALTAQLASLPKPVQTR